MFKKFSSFIEEYIIGLQFSILSLLIINSNIHLPCLPYIQNFFMTSETIIQMAFIFNPFIALLSSLPYGIASGYYGQKNALLCSLTIFIIGTIIIINSDSIQLFYLGRFFQSLGDAGAALVTGIILGNYCKGLKYSKIQAILSIVLSLAWAISPLLGKRIFIYFGWKGNFSFILIFSFIFLGLLFFWQEKKGIQEINYGTLCSFNSIKGRIISNLTPSFFVLSLAQALSLGVFTAFEFMIPFIYKDLYGYSVKEAANVLFVFVATNVLASLIYLFIINFIRPRHTLLIGIFFLLLYLFIGNLFFNFYQYENRMIAYLVFGAFSFSLPFILIFCSTKIVNSSPQDLGVTLSLLSIVRNVGTTFIPLLSCFLSYNLFSSFFNVTLIPIIISFIILLFILKID